MSQQLQKAIVQFNAKHVVISAKVVVLIMVVLLIANVAGTMLGLRQEPYFKGYLIIYSILLLLNVVCYRYFSKHCYSTETARTYKTLVATYVYGIILCGVCIAYIDVWLFNHYLMFLVIYFLCCALFIMRLRYFIVVSMISFGIVMVSLTNMDATYTEKVNNGIFLVNTMLIGVAIQYFISRAQRRVIEQDIELKKSVANAEHLTEELLKANEALMKQASYDYLTMIPNRNGFHAYATRTIQQEGQLTTLLMMDVDYFKQYNDFYNHAQGDQVLYDLAQIIHRVAVTYDGYAARWGGEEFLVMTTPAYAETICRDIQQEVANAAIVHERSQINNYVTVSIGGFSGMMTSIDELDDFYKNADRMLYEVKQHGRNHYRIEEAVTANT